MLSLAREEEGEQKSWPKIKTLNISLVILLLVGRLWLLWVSKSIMRVDLEQYWILYSHCRKVLMSEALSTYALNVRVLYINRSSKPHFFRKKKTRNYNCNNIVTVLVILQSQIGNEKLLGWLQRLFESKFIVSCPSSFGLCQDRITIA